MADTTTTATNYYKTVFRDHMGNDVPNASKMYAMIIGKGTQIEVGGRSLNATWSQNSFDGIGMGSLAEGGDFPAAGSAGAINYSLGLHHSSYSAKWTGHLDAQGSSTRMGWAGNYAKKLGNDIKNKVRSFRARMACHDGTPNWGQVATVSGGALGYITVTGVPIHFFVKGETLTIRDTPSSGSEQLTGGAGAGLIKDVDYVNERVYLADVTGAAAADYVAVSGFYDQTVTNGIKNICSNTGTIQGINRATVGNFLARAIYFDAGSTSLSPTDVDELRDLVQDVAGQRDGSYTANWCGNRKMRRWATLSTIGQNRFVDLNLSLGVASVDINDKDGKKKFIESEFLTDGDLYAPCFSKWVHAHPQGMKGGYPVLNNGSVFWQSTAAAGSGYADSRELYWILRSNIGADDFRCQGRRTNIVSP